MDTGKLNVRFDFTEGYEDEPYVLLEMDGPETQPLKIWEGLFADLLDNPDMSGRGWKGFTRDFHELKGIWNEEAEGVYILPEEYLEDLSAYKDVEFQYDETTEMYDSLERFLEDAKQRGCAVFAKCVE